MRVVDTPELVAFRDECRAWLADNVPRDARPPEGRAMRDFDLAWQCCQYEGGWAGVSWPREYGGRGLSVLEQLIWHEEYARAGGPPSGAMFVALSHAGPTLIARGSEAQKARHLPAILKGEENWCQGFSEPGAGSDLASLKCRAVIDGDHLVVAGTKIWTTYGNLATWQELLVRTDPVKPRHKGLTWVICPMDAPGIDIRPIEAMSGLTHFAQVFYDEVRVPLTNVIGEIDDGWGVAMATLGFERGTGTVVHQIQLANAVDRLVEAARETPSDDGSGRLIDDGAVLAAYLVGIAVATRDAAVGHARQREQFGQPIGAFQAIKHQCADMAVRAAAAEAQVRYAAVSFGRSGEDRTQAAAAWLLATGAALANAKACIQIHGAMGFTAECDVHMFLKRAHVVAALGSDRVPEDRRSLVSSSG